MKFKSNFLEVGMKIGLERNDRPGRTSYVSQVLDIVEPDRITVSGPMKKSQLVFIHKGDELKISYNVGEKGTFSFNAIVISRDYLPLYKLTLKRISEIRKIQLRNYFRLPISFEVNKSHLIDEENDEYYYETCEAKDVSGGGLRLNCKYKHKLGDRVKCSFFINDTLIEVTAVVVRVSEIDVYNYKYSLGLSFIDIKESSRDEIIKYIFEQQRILRIKGLI
ncbi:MAG: flagellar brake protein [Tissierellaceae bacterium]|nr:flagellar brake protein [Tissierellaceae bacterium]